MRAIYDHEYPPADWDGQDIAVALRSAGEPRGRGGIPIREDRDAWTSIRSDSLVGVLASTVLDQAEADAAEPVVQLPASLRRDYARGVDGARERYLDAHSTQLDRLTRFAIAECLENEGRFVDRVLDYAWALCERTSWVYDGNQSEAEERGSLAIADPAPEETTIDLASSRTGFRLAEVDYLLGDVLPAGLRERIRQAVDRRLLQPYECRDDFWWLKPTTNNWNAVCNGNTLGAALYLESDVDRVGAIAERVAGSLYDFLTSFDPDGGTAEGISYWNYGFGHYVRAAAILAAQTAGEFDLLDVPIVAEIAHFPARIELSPGRFPAFSDGREDAALDPAVACHLGRRFEDPWLLATARSRLESDGEALTGSVRNLAWCTGVPDVDPPTAADQAYFRGLEWWIARTDPSDPDAPVVAAKGGDNEESHNHNDCGSFIYHTGRESVLTELGAPEYPPDYFDAGTRYTHLPARSLGHNVPLVNGTEQASPTVRDANDPAGDGAARVLDRTRTDARTTFSLELAPCYPAEVGLESLRRDLTLDRSSGHLMVTDRATFDAARETRLESVLVSYARMDDRDGELVITGNRGSAVVETDAPIEVEELPEAMKASLPGGGNFEYRDVWRARIGPGTVTDRTARIELDIRSE